MRPGGRGQREADADSDYDGDDTDGDGEGPLGEDGGPAFDAAGTPTEELKMVLCVNDELKMGKGKIAAQCAHAAVGAVTVLGQHAPRLLRFYNANGQPKIAVRCPDLATLRLLEGKARGLGLPTYLVQDAGRTQIAAGSRTVLAVGPGPKSFVDQVTGDLKLL